MNNSQIHNIFTDLLAKNDFILAEKIILENIKKDILNGQLWIDLAEVLKINGYVKSAKKVYRRAMLIDASLTWNNNLESLLKGEETGKDRQDIEVLLQVPPVSVCAAIIVKNEEVNIKRCIESIIDAVDEIVVVDTGSTDNTVNILMQFSKVKLYHYDWKDDFAAARNYGLSKVESDWVFWIDADESLYPEDKSILKEVVGLYNDFKYPSVLCITKVNKIGDSEVISNDEARIFPTNCNLEYYGRVHEQVVLSQWREELIPFIKIYLRVSHVGYETDIIKSKLERNIKLLKVSVEEEPNEPTWQFLYGRELYYSGKFSAAIEALKKAVQLYSTNFDQGRILDAFYFLALAFRAINDHEEAEKVCMEGLKWSKDFPNFHYLLSEIYCKKFEEYMERCANSLNEAIKGFDTYKGFVTPDFDILKWKGSHMVSNLNQKINYIKDNILNIVK